MGVDDADGLQIGVDDGGAHEDGDEEAYLDYIRRVADNKMAARVKKEDLKHNMDMSRIQNPTEKDRKRRAKYEKALQLLEELTEVE